MLCLIKYRLEMIRSSLHSLSVDSVSIFLESGLFFFHSPSSMSVTDLRYSLVPLAGHLLDHFHRPLLLREGGDWHVASRGRPRCPAVVRHLHPGWLPYRSPHHVSSGQRLSGVCPGSGLRG